jgi:hypothetical protein
MLSRLMLRTARGVQLKGVVVARVNVADVFDIRRHAFVGPAVAAEDELAIGQARGDVEEKFFDAGFAIGQTVAEESEIALEPVIRRDWMMRLWIECVVNGNAAAGVEAFVSFDDGMAAAVGED